MATGERPPPSGDDDTELPAAARAEGDDAGERPARMRAIGPGDELGRYVVGEELGAGGMATVFRARDRELRRDVAIKVLFPHLARKADVTRRFQREARAAAGLEHPNILRVYDVGGASGDLPPYIVMELVRGTTLRELAEGTPLPAELVACVGVLVCEALAVAHAAGIVHRDVKPGNVMFADDGRLLLADFGVARLDDDDSLVTRTGALLGTPSFMAPEQAMGQEVDARSDLYAVGATLYQLATGSMPYTGPTAKIVTEASRGSATPAVRRRPAIGTELSRLIARLMEPDPAKRPQSAAEAARELMAVAHAGGLDDPAAELRGLAADREGTIEEMTPRIVVKLVERAEKAKTRRAMPLALALCDRALALAPDDPKVHALEAALSDRGSVLRLKLVGLAIFAVTTLVGGVWMIKREARRAAMLDAGLAGDATAVIATGAVDGGAAAPDDAAALVAIAPDAAAMIAPSPDAGRGRTDAGRAALALDAATAIDARAAIDAAALAPIDAAAPAIDAGPALVAVTFTSDAWCELTVDGAAHGRVDRSRPVTVRLAVGRYPAVCKQGQGLGAWSRTIDVTERGPDRVAIELLARVEVVAGVGDEVRIDGVTVPRDSSLMVKPGGRLVVVVTGGTAAPVARVEVPTVARCTLRDQPRLGCYP